MNVPLEWLSQYVTLPESEKELTDKLTMVGHMLDKRKEVNGDIVIDLELRGNRADMFGIVGVAREVSALFKTPLQKPSIATLDSTGHTSSLLAHEKNIDSVIQRYIAIKLSVRVGPSPEWLTKRLMAYGIEPINNVVDITNYVMVETSHPMHAFDFDQIQGGVLHLRKAKAHETLETIQQGTTLTLTPEDIVIADTKGAQCTTSIGGAKTKVTDQTTTIILETAVYDAATCRRSARRHKIFTESGNRHEKHQDPEELSWVLARAVKLLEEVADAKIVSSVSDFYPNPVTPTIVSFSPHAVKRLVGITIPNAEMMDILKQLEFDPTSGKDKWSIVVPSFRTDIEQEADIVEEIARVYGYENIPTKTLSGVLPKPATAPIVLLSETVRDELVKMQLNEVITASIIENNLVNIFGQTSAFANPIQLVNVPDPEIATLRPSLLPNLALYAKRNLGFRQSRIALFEVGKTYTTNKKIKYKEQDSLGILLGGTISTTRWNKTDRDVDFFDAKGVTEGVLTQLGIVVQLKPISTHPSLSEEEQLSIYLNDMLIGAVGKIHDTILESIGVTKTLYAAEVSLEALAHTPRNTAQPYIVAPQYPPIIEDMTFVVQGAKSFGGYIDEGKKISSLIQSLALIGAYENKRTVRVTYADEQKTLTGSDIKPLREQLIQLAEKFDATLQQ